MVSVKLHHGLEGKLADDITVEDEERVWGLREQVPGERQRPSWGERTRVALWSA